MKNERASMEQSYLTRYLNKHETIINEPSIFKSDNLCKIRLKTLLKASLTLVEVTDEGKVFQTRKTST